MKFSNQIYEIDLLVKYGIHHLYNKQTNKSTNKREEKKENENWKEEEEYCRKGGVTVGAEWIYIKKYIYFYLYIRKKHIEMNIHLTFPGGGFSLFVVKKRKFDEQETKEFQQ